eukprot:g15311.t1
MHADGPLGPLLSSGSRSAPIATGRPTAAIHRDPKVPPLLSLKLQDLLPQARRQRRKYLLSSEEEQLEEEQEEADKAIGFWKSTRLARPPEYFLSHIWMPEDQDTNQHDYAAEKVSLLKSWAVARKALSEDRWTYFLARVAPNYRDIEILLPESLQQPAAWAELMKAAAQFKVEDLRCTGEICAWELVAELRGLMVDEQGFEGFIRATSLALLTLEGLLRHNAHCAAFGGTFLESAVEACQACGLKGLAKVLATAQPMVWWRNAYRQVEQKEDQEVKEDTAPAPVRRLSLARCSPRDAGAYAVRACEASAAKLARAAKLETDFLQDMAAFRVNFRRKERERLPSIAEAEDGSAEAGIKEDVRGQAELLVCLSFNGKTWRIFNLQIHFSDFLFVFFSCVQGWLAGEDARELCPL